MLLGLAVALLVGSAFAVAAGRAKPKNDLVPDYAAVQRHLQNLIVEKGAARAYAALHKELEGESVGIRHGTAHVFGELLFETEGLAGLGVCDQAFTFGCYHGFLGRAVNKNGIDIVSSLNAGCVAANGEGESACRHGLGHGILDYIGPSHLTDAYAVCRKIGWDGLLGCGQGVIMEYLQSRDRIFTFESGAPLRPCDGLSADLRPSCYFELPYAWYFAKLDFPKMRELCFGLQDEDRRACLLGLGRAAGELQRYDAAAARSACADSTVCEAGAYWLFTAVGKDPGPLCAGENGAACKAEAAALK